MVTSIKMLKDIANKIINILVKIVNLLLLILSISLLLIFIFKKEWFELFIEWMKVTISGLGLWNYGIVLLSSCVEGIPVLGVLLPGQNILLIVGGFFGNISQTNLIYVVIVSSIGAIIGNYIGFALGRYYGDYFFIKYGLRIGVGKTELKYLKKGIDKWGPLGITVGKFHPMTRAFLPFIAGGMGMKLGRFMLYNAIGSIVRATTIILIGVVFVKYYKILLENSGTISVIVLALILAYIYKFKRAEFKKYLEEKNAELKELQEKNNSN